MCKTIDNIDSGCIKIAAIAGLRHKNFDGYKCQRQQFSLVYGEIASQISEIVACPYETGIVYFIFRRDNVQFILRKLSYNSFSSCCNVYSVVCRQQNVSRYDVSCAIRAGDFVKFVSCGVYSAMQQPHKCNHDPVAVRRRRERALCAGMVHGRDRERHRVEHGAWVRPQEARRVL